jgi:hypothetical protein
MDETFGFKEHVKYSVRSARLSPGILPPHISPFADYFLFGLCLTFRVRSELCGVNKSIKDKPVVFNLTLSQMKKNWEAQRATKSKRPVSRTREDLGALAASPGLPRLRQRNDLVLEQMLSL